MRSFSGFRPAVEDHQHFAVVQERVHLEGVVDERLHLQRQGLRMSKGRHGARATQTRDILCSYRYTGRRSPDPPYIYRLPRVCGR